MGGQHDGLFLSGSPPIFYIYVHMYIFLMANKLCCAATHISGHPSAAGRGQDSESSPIKRPTFYRSTTQPTNIPMKIPKPGV